MKHSGYVLKPVVLGLAPMLLVLFGCEKGPVDPGSDEGLRSYTFQVSTTSASPIAGAIAAIRLPGTTYQGSTDQQGVVTIPVPASVTLPAFVIVTIDHGKFMPAAVSVPGTQNCCITRAITCAPAPSQTLLREVRLHHLGDNHYGGDPNSQLQITSEGIRMTFPFTLTSIPSLMPYLRLHGRGIQYKTKIKVNGVQVSSLGDSPANGDLGFYNSLLGGTATTLLKKGVNTLEFETGYDASINDYDDIEFCSVMLYFK